MCECETGGMALHLTGDTAADTLLTNDAFALLVGMLLDQQVPMETAFAGPQKLHERLETFDAPTVASMGPVEFGAVFAEKPAVHRFPASMAKHAQELARIVVDDWDGDAAAIWQSGDPDGAEALRRLETLPGFGAQKSRIFLAVLGKQVGFAGAGWREASDPYGEAGSMRSVADVIDAESLAQVRAAKKAAKAAAKASKE